MSRKKSKEQRKKKLQAQGLDGDNSKYARKVKSGRQMYGDGKRGCGHRFKPNHQRGAS